jgi:hypothetical protein
MLGIAALSLSTMAERSFSVAVENYTGRNWSRSDFSFSHGEWSNNGADIPPENIAKASVTDDGDAQPGIVLFAAEDGDFLGCKGFVDYASDLGTIQIQSVCRREYIHCVWASRRQFDLG